MEFDGRKNVCHNVEDRCIRPNYKNASRYWSCRQESETNECWCPHLKATRRLLVCNCQQRVPDLRPSVVKVGVVVSAFQMPHEAPFKGKANVKTQFALQTYWGVEVQLLAYLTLALGGGEPFRRSRESCVFKLVQLTPWTRV